MMADFSSQFDAAFGSSGGSQGASAVDSAGNPISSGDIVVRPRSAPKLVPSVPANGAVPIDPNAPAGDYQATAQAPTPNAPDFSNFESAFSGSHAKVQSDNTAQELAKETPTDRFGSALTYGIANAVPFAKDLGALADTGVSYLPGSPGKAGSNPKDQSGESFSQRFQENKARINEIDQANQDQFPVTSIAAPIAASIAALPVAGPVDALSAIGGRVLPSVAADALATGAVGAGYGAMYGAGNGEGIDDRLSKAGTGALYGGVAGAAMGPIAGTLGKVAGAVMSPFRGALDPTAQAASRVSSALERDAASGSAGLSGSDIASAGQSGQSPVLADVGGEATRALARSAANSSPEARAALADAANERFSTQNTRFSDFMKGMFGTDLNNQTVRDDLARRAAAVVGPAYKTAYAKGAGGIWDQELQAFANVPAVKSAIGDATHRAATDAFLNKTAVIKNPFVADANGNMSLAKDANGNVAYPTLQFWDQVKRSLDGSIGAAKRSGNNEDVRDLSGLKNALLKNLDRAVPEYADARLGAFKAFGAENALEAGEKFLGMSKSSDIDAVRKSLGKMNPTQREFFAQGLASQIAQKAENTSERRNIIGLFNNPTTAEKMELGLGVQRAAQIQTYLRRESMMDMLRTALGNSTTARQQAEGGMASGHGVGGMIGSALSSPVAGAGAGALAAYHEHGLDPVEIGKYAAAGAIGGLLGKFAKDANHNVVRSIGEMLASDDPAMIQRGVAAVASKPNLSNAMKASEMAMERLVRSPVPLAAHVLAPPAQQNNDNN